MVTVCDVAALYGGERDANSLDGYLSRDAPYALMDAVGRIDDGLITEAASYKRKTPGYLKAAIGMAASFLVSIAAIRFLMIFIRTRDFKPFGIYRIIIGIVILLYFAAAH